MAELVDQHLQRHPVLQRVTMKKGQLNPEGVGIGGGVRVTPGVGPAGAGVSLMRGADQPIIDVEGWRPAIGTCPSR